MEWLSGLNEGLHYIEERLADEIDYQEIAKIAGCSLYNYQRIFSYIAGVPLAEYIRRRRMTCAAFELGSTDNRILDLALKYGYESAESFSRAFFSQHGISPTQARKKGTQIKAFPKMRFQLSVKGVQEMNYRIETKESFTVYGIEGRFTMEDGQNIKEIPRFWSEKMENGELDALIQSSGNKEDGTFPVRAVCGYEKSDKNDFPYMLCVMKGENSDTKGYKVVQVPAATWVILKNNPHNKESVVKEIQKLITSFYSDWLPASGYKIVGGYDIEAYCSTSDGSCYEEYWVQVNDK